MDLGVRRDSDEKFDIDSQILARHAAMLGSTGSGKTVMALHPHQINCHKIHKVLLKLIKKR